MKKLLILAVLAALFCSGAVAEGAITAFDVAEANDELLLLGKYKSIGVNTVYYSLEGEEEISFYAYASIDENGNAMYVYEDSDKNVEIVKDGRGVGFDAVEVQTYSIGFVMDLYEMTIDGNIDNLITIPSDENVTADIVYNSDDIIFTEEVLYEDGAASVINYKLDKDTLLMREIQEFYRDEEGTQTHVATAFITYGVDYQISDELNALFNPTDTRKVIVIVKGDGEADQTFEFAPPADAMFMLSYPFEYITYKDADLEEFYDNEYPVPGEGFPAETTIYLGRFE